jgi:hypothetical protein
MTIQPAIPEREIPRPAEPGIEQPREDPPPGPGTEIPWTEEPKEEPPPEEEPPLPLDRRPDRSNA